MLPFVPEPATRKRSSPEQLREEILAAAIHFFADQGYAGTSVKQIAESVGISKQLLLYHFSSKEELRAEVLGWLARQWKDFLPKLLAAVSGDSDPFQAAVESWVELFTANPDIPRYVLRDLITPNSEVPKLLLELVGPGMLVTGDALKRLQDDGALAKDANPQAMLSVVGLTLFAVFAVSGADKHKEAHAPFNEGMLEEALRMIRAGLKT